MRWWRDGRPVAVLVGAEVLAVGDPEAPLGCVVPAQVAQRAAAVAPLVPCDLPEVGERVGLEGVGRPAPGLLAGLAADDDGGEAGPAAAVAEGEVG